MERVNEGSYHTITVSFTDEELTPVTPDAASYRIDDLSSGAEIVPNTEFIPGASSYVIEIPGEINKLLNPIHDVETWIVTVTFVYDATKVGTAEYRYWLQRLDYLPLFAESS